jgi:DNA-binding MarR family transcriptional regulator
MATHYPLSEINRNLHRLVFHMDKVAEDLLQEHFGLTFSQFRMLMAVEKGGLSCQAHIAQFFGLTPAAISRQIDILTGKKLLIAKTNSNNRREHILELTSKGKESSKQAIELLEKRFNQIYIILSKNEQKVFAESLEKLTQEFCKKPPIN